MSKKQMLQEVLADFESRTCVRIELVWADGRRGGIGNHKAIEVAMNALLGELERQIEEED